jgi:ABC-type transport system involved in multi-copper enzyme maturation permease subunit
MKTRTMFARLLTLELQTYWSFPALELVIFTALLSILNNPPFFGGYQQLNSGIYGLGILLQMLIIGVLVPRSFAGSISRRETNVLLSYPTKRTILLASKIAASFLVFFGALSLGVLFNVYLLGVSYFELAPYVLIAVISVQILFLCGLSLFISLLLKNEVLSIFAFLLIMFGLEFNPAATSGFLSNFTQIRSNNVMFQYLTTILYGSKATVTLGDFGIAIGFPLLTGLALIAASFIYFRWVLQLD